MLVCCCQHVVQLLFGSKAFLHFGSKDWPIAVITRELGIGLGAIILVAIREWIHTPRIPWVLGDRRNPDSGNTQFLEEALLDFLFDTLDVATLIIHNVQHFGAIHLPVVLLVAVVEAVNHQRVEDLCMVVKASEFSHVIYHFAVLHWNEQVVQVFAISIRIYTDKTATFAFAPCRFDSDDCFGIVLTILYQFFRTCVLPEHAELQVLILVEHCQRDSRVAKGFGHQTYFVLRLWYDRNIVVQSFGRYVHAEYGEGMIAIESKAFSGHIAHLIRWLGSEYHFIFCAECRQVVCEDNLSVFAYECDRHDRILGVRICFLLSTTRLVTAGY